MFRVSVCAQLSVLDIEVSTKCLPKIRKRGGVWRAWVRHHSLGGTGTADLEQLAREYRLAKERDDPLLKKLHRWSEAARHSVLVRRQNKSGSTLGPRKKDLVRHSLKAYRVSLWKRTRRQAPRVRATAIATEVIPRSGLSDALATAHRQSGWTGCEKESTLPISNRP